jgi:hypothetical protein
MSNCRASEVEGLKLKVESPEKREALKRPKDPGIKTNPEHSPIRPVLPIEVATRLISKYSRIGSRPDRISVLWKLGLRLS